jgi:hypothetical protein
MKLVAATALAGGLLMMAGGANATVIFSEDFSGYDTLNIAHGAHFASSAGNTITSDYSYRIPNGENHGNQADSMYDEGTWTIATNPDAVHDLWINLPDNQDPFLILNGATSNANPPPIAYESQVLQVGPGTYSYSYDILNVCCNFNHPPGVQSVLQLWYVKGDSQQNIGSIPLDINSVVATQPSANGWTHVTGNFTITQPGGFIRLGLSDTNAAADGNDFGVDNLRLASAPEPAAWALMIMGFGAAGAMVRRRTRVLA